MLYYNQKEKRKEVKTMKTQGTYIFADGYTAWFHGLSAAEKRNEERKHGKVVRFIPGP